MTTAAKIHSTQLKLICVLLNYTSIRTLVSALYNSTRLNAILLFRIVHYFKETRFVNKLRDEIQ